MKKLIIIFLLLTLFIPVITSAAGLVPCGGPDENPCTACDLLVLAENVIHFTLITAFAIVVILAITAGFRMIFSGGNEANIKAAQKSLATALIGLTIILCSYLIVNTIFWLMAKIGGPESDYTGTWWQLKCEEKEISYSNGNDNGGNNNNGNDGGNGGEENNGGQIYQYGDVCRRLKQVPPYDCHLEQNCCLSTDDCDLVGLPMGQIDCPDGWVCCVAKKGATDPPMPTPPTTESTGCPNNSPKVQGTCFKYTCRPPCDNPNGPLQCLPTLYYTEPMCLKEYKEYICPGHEVDTCDWKNLNSCNN